jgi:hypothetical protein
LETSKTGLFFLRVPLIALFAWLISHQPTVFFSQNKSATSNQPAVLFSQNKSAPATSNQPNEQVECFWGRLNRGFQILRQKTSRFRSFAVSVALSNGVVVMYVRHLSR